MDQPNQKRTFHSLQYLRALAAVLVVVAHTTEYPVSAGNAVPFWTGRTSILGVEIFFVISGFIIVTVCGPGRFDPLVFAGRRFLRVAPLYWVCTTALFVLASLAPHLFKTTAADGASFLKSLLFVPYAQPGEGANHWSPLLKPGWTLNVEVFFYALTGLLFFSRHRVAALTLLLGGLVLLDAAGLPKPGVLDFYARKDLLAFLAGSWLAVGTNRWLTPDRAGRLLGPVAACGPAALALVFALPTEEAGAIAAIPAGALVVGCALLVEMAGRLPRLASIERIGDASYSLYLTHMFTVGLIWSLLARRVDTQAFGPHVLGTAAATVAAVGVAFVSYRVIEEPFLRLSRRLMPGRAGPRRLTGGSADRGSSAVPAPASRA